MAPPENAADVTFAKGIHMGHMGLSRFKVRTRIFAGFGFLVLLSAALAAFTLLQLGAIRAQVSKMTALQVNVTRVMEADHAFETIRRGLTTIVSNRTTNPRTTHERRAPRSRN